MISHLSQSKSTVCHVSASKGQSGPNINTICGLKNKKKYKRGKGTYALLWYLSLCHMERTRNHPSPAAGCGNEETHPLRSFHLCCRVWERLTNTAEGRIHISSEPHKPLLSLAWEITGFTKPVLYVNVRVSMQGGTTRQHEPLWSATNPVSLLNCLQKKWCSYSSPSSYCMLTACRVYTSGSQTMGQVLQGGMKPPQRGVMMTKGKVGGLNWSCWRTELCTVKLM